MTATLPFAFEEAALRGATLVAVHAGHFPAPAGDPKAGEAGHPADPGKIWADATRNQAETLQTWREKYPDVPVRQEVTARSSWQLSVGN
jgi:hypothetical protein